MAELRIPAAQSSQVAVAQHKVLRNTYMLLALSMVPTMIGAMIGINMQVSFMATNPIMGGLLFLAGAFGFFYAIEKTKNSGLGVALLLAFTFFMGLWLSQILQVALSFGNGGQIIGLAAGGTAAIFFTLAGIATVTRRDFSFMGNFLTIGAVLFLIAIVANLFFQVPAVSLTISAVAVLLFSGFILYDVSRIIHGGETNYISATLGLYLSIYNLFVSLLHLLLAFTGQRE
ncbi:MAG: Bax inhibitor-1/YccA family protein [Burkholderiales bacterium]|nr:Bax inhibitor-1/YccA family protein [Burkholderiales bacterium]MDQ3194881.1 Bax inhibitor-1/YccA family protein [Pseudomonadota bacterium]